MKKGDKQLKERNNKQCEQNIQKNNKVAIELSRKREHEHSTSTTFVRLFV